MRPGFSRFVIFGIIIFGFMILILTFFFQKWAFSTPPINELELDCPNGCQDNEKKVLLCHVPPGNPDNTQTLCVNESALGGHITQHGGDFADYCGECVDDGGGDGEGCEERCGEENEKSLLCHVPSEDPEKADTLCIADEAVSSHLEEHEGDHCGPCDLCPEDENKTEPGVCGCGVPDTDTDGDGFPDCIDDCPEDPEKVGPGICGCGTADTDTDEDGIPDCNDLCPGIPDDFDGDGALDCEELCPKDPAKTAPGLCGCGVSEVDLDGDGTPDCIDNCPFDPAKINPGICGCGNPDEDANGNGIVDCIDDSFGPAGEPGPGPGRGLGVAGCGNSLIGSDIPVSNLPWMLTLVALAGSSKLMRFLKGRRNDRR